MTIRQGKSWVEIPIPALLVEDPEILYIIAGQAEYAQKYVHTRAFQNIDMRTFFSLLGYLLVTESHALYIIQNFNFILNKSLPQGLFYLHGQLEWHRVKDFLAKQLRIEIPPFHLISKLQGGNIQETIKK